MMQQQLYQQEQQPGTQDASGHQMVLCPVRLVYETQMLVQPGEQLQPNQTIFINPQNPPPWIQNRPVQNQVIYVQPMQNYVQPQQHIDPNQLYIQNYGYQNIPQMLVQNPQDQIRPMQMIQQNIGPNAQIGQTVQTQRLIPNVNQISNTLNLVNTAQSQNVSMNRQITQNQIANISELVNNVKQENVSQNIYRPVAPTIAQDPRNQLQQTVTLVPTNIQRPPNIYEPNMSQVQAVPPQNIANVQSTYQNTILNVQDTRKISMPINKTNNYSIVHPNTAVKMPQTFRPIQPRAQAQIRNSGPQFQLAVQPATNLVQPTTPNVVNINTPRKMIASKTVQIPSVSITNSPKTEGNITINRKRKSESPDEIQKKISVSNQVENPIIIKRIENIVTNPVNCSDVGVNTSPIHKPDGRITISNLQITPLNPNNQNLKIKEELAKKLSYTVPEIPMVVRNDVPNTTPNSILSEKDKLIRNTVFTQARGRVLNDKDPIIEPNKIEITPNTPVNNPIASVSIEAQKPIVTNPNTVSTEVKKPEEAKLTDAVVTPIVTEKKPEIKEPNCIKQPKKVTSNETADEIKLKKDRDFILTHVLDGYVIQESNIAFPIRKPLKEKVLPNNSEEGDAKTDIKEAKSEKDGVKNNSKILNISHLHIKDIEVKNNDMDTDKENPFRNLKPGTVKSWTADQLAEHLSKYSWNETVAVLQEHEIDGESLLLVSKGQLLTIGIKEEHAEIISDFVKS